jgi:ADP-ribosylglycohydrolase
VIDLNEIAKQYSRWMNSPPFDIGEATTNAFKPLVPLDLDSSDFSSTAKAASSDLNQNSQSNGALMRITPLIVWASSLPDADFLRVIISDVQHTNPNRLVHDAVKIYSMALKMLLNYPKDENRVIMAINKCQELAMEDEYEDPETGESVFMWLSNANDLYEMVDHNDLANFQPLREFGLDCT